MTAVLRVNLRETEHFRVGERTAKLCAEAFEIINLVGIQCKTFLNIVFLNIIDVNYRVGSLGYGENTLVETLVYSLKHFVVFGCVGVNFEILFNTRDAVQPHVLGNFYGICAPRGNHFTTRPYEHTFKRL